MRITAMEEKLMQISKNYKTFCAAAVAVFWAWAPFTPAAMADDEVKRINTEVQALFNSGKYSEATVMAEKALEHAEKLKLPDFPDVLDQITTLGTLYSLDPKRKLDYERVIQRGLAITEILSATDKPQTHLHKIWLRELINIYESTGRISEAEFLKQRPSYIPWP
jgi:hypothetical protein